MLRVDQRRRKFQLVDISRGSRTSFWMPRAEASVEAENDKDCSLMLNIFTINYIKCFVILSSVPVMSVCRLASCPSWNFLSPTQIIFYLLFYLVPSVYVILVRIINVNHLILQLLLLMTNMGGMGHPSIYLQVESLDKTEISI